MGHTLFMGFLVVHILLVESPNKWKVKIFDVSNGVYEVNISTSFKKFK